METPVYILLSQQEALGKQMEVVSQNIANANTTGYQARGVLFEEYIEQNQSDVSSTRHFVVDRATYRNTLQGGLQKTSNPLDVAINGEGYFAVRTKQGVQYTRQGSFQLDAEGNLVTVDGFPVLDAGGQPINIPANAKDVGIGSDGTVSTDVGIAGQLKVATFSNQQNMTETFGGYYTTNETPKTEGKATVVQGMLEGSNVNPLVQMASIIEISRGYQRIANLVSAENDRLKNTIARLGKVA